MDKDTLLVYWNKDLYEKYHNIFPIKVYELEEHIEQEDPFYNSVAVYSAVIRSYVNRKVVAIGGEVDLSGGYSYSSNGAIIIGTVGYPPTKIAMEIPIDLYSIFYEDLELVVLHTISWGTSTL